MKERENRSRGGGVVNSELKRFFMLMILIFLVAFLAFSYRVFENKGREYADKVQKVEDLEIQIANENERLKHLKKQESRVVTDEDIEAIARQELGLIKRDEIVLRPNQ